MDLKEWFSRYSKNRGNTHVCCREGCRPYMWWTSPSPCVYNWVHVVRPDDRDWVIQGRVSALSVRLLFYTHVDLGLRMKSARLPDPESQTALIPPSANAVDHWSHWPLNELAYGFRRTQTWSSPCFPSFTDVLAVQMHMFGAKCSPPGGKPCVGGQWSPVLNSVRVGGLWWPRGFKLRAQPDE